MGYLRLPTLTARRKAMKVGMLLLRSWRRRRAAVGPVAVGPRPAQVQAYAGSSTSSPASPSSSGRKVSTMTASSSKYSTPIEASIALGCGPWAWPPGWMRDRADVDARALARLVVAADVEHHLVGVDVGVVVGHRDRLLVVVDLARAEVADHEVVALEDLVHRRRLVHLAGDRHEVLDVERVGVEAPVPPDDVERVGGVGHPRADQTRRTVAAVLDEHLDVGALLHERLGRPVQVALAVRRVLEELAEPGEVALRRRDVAVRLDGVEPRDLAVDVARQPAVRGRPRDQHVVAGAVAEHAEDVSTVPDPDSTYTHSSPTALR